jgi:hypothetical protein
LSKGELLIIDVEKRKRERGLIIDGGWRLRGRREER